MTEAPSLGTQIPEPCDAAINLGLPWGIADTDGGADGRILAAAEPAEAGDELGSPGTGEAVLETDSEAGVPAPETDGIEDAPDHLTDDERHRWNHLGQQRRRHLKQIRGEVERRETALAGIETAKLGIAKASQDLRNARVVWSVRVEQAAAAERRQGEHEAMLLELNKSRDHLRLTPFDRRAKEARQERARLKAEAEAADAAAREAHESELVEVLRPHERILKGSKTVGWSNIAKHNQVIKIPRRDV